MARVQLAGHKSTRHSAQHPAAIREANLPCEEGCVKKVQLAGDKVLVTQRGILQQSKKKKRVTCVQAASPQRTTA
jgi:hypothetical protein